MAKAARKRRKEAAKRREALFAMIAESKAKRELRKAGGIVPARRTRLSWSGVTPALSLAHGGVR